MKRTDKISENAIKKHLKNKVHFDFKILESIDSTNIEARRLAENSAEQWTVVIADTQTSGKGRMNRKFCSPQGCGIYMSIILKPNFSAEEALTITTSAAVAVSNAIEIFSLKKTGIKWVNDIYIDDKKVCGILTEAAMEPQSNKLKYAILGIGINVFEPKNGFPNEIKDIAGALFDNTVEKSRNELIANILNEFTPLYGSLPDKKYMELYRKRSILTGKKIDILKCGEVCGEGTVLDIDDNLELIIKNDDGTIEILSSGEVSVKKKI